MFGIDLGNIIAFVCGMLCMWALSNPRKAAQTIRGFLGRASKGVDNLNKQYSPKQEKPKKRRTIYYHDNGDD